MDNCKITDDKKGWNRLLFLGAILILIILLVVGFVYYLFWKESRIKTQVKMNARIIDLEEDEKRKEKEKQERE